MFVPLVITNDDGEETELLDIEADAFLTEDFVADKLMLKNIRSLLQSKPRDVKKIFYLFYDLGQSIPEIAKALMMSESSVKHKLYRTLKEIRNLLK